MTRPGPSLSGGAAGPVRAGRGYLPEVQPPGQRHTARPRAEKRRPVVLRSSNCCQADRSTISSPARGVSMLDLFAADWGGRNLSGGNIAWFDAAGLRDAAAPPVASVPR